MKKFIKKSDFHWTPEAEQAFKQLKQHLSELPLLVAPKPKEELIVYMSASYGAVSARLRRTVTKVERHAGGTQYHIPAKDTGERTDPGGLPCREAGQKSTRHISCGNPAGAVDTIHRWIVMCRYIRRWLNTDKHGRNGVHLRAKVLVEILKEKFIQEKEVEVIVEEEGPTWMTPIIEYLKDGTIPYDRKEASKLRIKARQYELLEGVLYRRSFLKSWLRNLQQPLTPITTPWPFYKWGIDIAGPFPEGPGKVKFLIVAMDYFTKWIEAKSMATITSNQVKKFVWDNIVCRFRLPGEIVSDN
ncbi:reverse transcriptase domain-containing protein, partial [Tanacetum coccineum]